MNENRNMELGIKNLGFGILPSFHIPSIPYSAFLAIFLIPLFLIPSLASAGVLIRPVNNLGLVGYWPFDEGSGTTANDYSGQGNTGTLVSSPTWVTGQLNRALSFNGTSYVDVGSPASLIGLTNAVTESVWVKRGVSATAGGIAGTYGSLDQGYNLTFGIGNANNDKFCFTLQGITDYCTSGTYPDTTKWHLLTATYDRTNVNLYYDGTLVNTFSQSAAMTVANGTFSIGRRTPRTGTCSTGCPFNGSLDDVRIYNRALSVGDVKLLYQQGYAQVTKAKLNTAPVIIPAQNFANGLVGYWPMEEGSGATTRDIIGGNNGALQNSPTWVKGKYGGALSFNGTNQYIDMGAGSTAPAFNFAGDVTEAAWVKVSNITANNSIVINYQNGNAATTYLAVGTISFVVSNPHHLTAYTRNTAGTAAFATGSKVIDDNKWHFLAFTRNTTTQTLSVYVDGVLDGSTVSANVTGAIDTRGGTHQIGNAVLPGTIDDARVYNRALSASEIKQLYLNESVNIGHSNATVPNGLVGWWTLDGNNLIQNVTDSSGQGNNGTLVSFTSTSSAEVAGKIGGALKFNGTNQAVNVGSPAAFRITGPQSYAAWVKVSAPQASYIYRATKSGQQDIQFSVNTTSGFGFYLFNIFGGSPLLSTTIPVVGKWYYVVATYDGTTARIYVNGAPDNSKPASGSVSVSAGTTYYLGYDAGITFFNGAIDDMRIYNRALSAQEVQNLYAAGR